MSAVQFQSEAIPLKAVAGEPLRINHGRGKPTTGWVVVWADAPVTFHVQDPKADTRFGLTLIPSADANVKIALI